MTFLERLAAELDALRKELSTRLQDIRVREIIIARLEAEFRALRLDLVIAEADLERQGCGHG